MRALGAVQARQRAAQVMTAQDFFYIFQHMGYPDDRNIAVSQNPKSTVWSWWLNSVNRIIPSNGLEVAQRCADEEWEVYGEKPCAEPHDSHEAMLLDPYFFHTKESISAGTLWESFVLGIISGGIAVLAATIRLNP